jgi:uncharacterized protein
VHDTGYSAPDEPRPSAPTRLSERALAPDLARGVMLLLIALANAPAYLFDHPAGSRGYPDPVSQLVTLLQMLLVDTRAYPLFALLFGYGVVQLARRRGDPDAARRLVRRRGWWMALIGVLHGILLFSGDIVAAYGLLAVLVAGLLISGRDRTLLCVGSAGLIVISLISLSVGMGVPSPPGAGALPSSMTVSSVPLAMMFRLGEFPAVLVSSMLVAFGAVALGAWAARRRILDEPAAHRAMLTKAAVGGLAVAVLGGLPLALMAAGYWTDPGTTATSVANALHIVTGYAGGIGYAALFALVAARMAERRGAITRALVACGQRSLTCYLAQSVVFVGLLSAAGAGLGGQLTAAWTALLALGTWLVILLGAELMRRYNIRGPAEVLLRRLTYRGRPLSSTGVSGSSVDVAIRRSGPSPASRGVDPGELASP